MCSGDTGLSNTTLPVVGILRWHRISTGLSRLWGLNVNLTSDIPENRRRTAPNRAVRLSPWDGKSVLI